jgi:hypothetical protein
MSPYVAAHHVDSNKCARSTLHILPSLEYYTAVIHTPSRRPYRKIWPRHEVWYWLTGIRRLRCQPACSWHAQVAQRRATVVNFKAFSIVALPERPRCCAILNCENAPTLRRKTETCKTFAESIYRPLRLREYGMKIAAVTVTHGFKERVCDV